MKTAIILTGNLRTWELCKESFLKTFDENIDIFICVSNVKYDYHPYIQENFTGSDDSLLSEADIIESFQGLNLKKVIIQNKEEEVSFISEEKKKFKMDISSLNIFSMFGSAYKMKKALSSLEDYENENDFKYDRIIKTRFDLIYNQVDLNHSNDSILLDSGNAFPNDVFLMSNRNSIVNIINFMYDEFYISKYNTSHLQAPHGLLLNAINDKNLNIETQPIINCVIRKDYGAQYY